MYLKDENCEDIIWPVLKCQNSGLPYAYLQSFFDGVRIQSFTELLHDHPTHILNMDKIGLSIIIEATFK